MVRLPVNPPQFGSTDTFDIVPAVRSPTGSCVDEANCDWEKVTLCGFAQLSASASKVDFTATKAKVDFLVCMDESNLSSATSAGKSCANKGGIDASAIEKCFQGEQATSFLQAASDRFNAKLPGRTTIPHLFVNDVDTSPSYAAISGALCKDGSKASVCDHHTECYI